MDNRKRYNKEFKLEVLEMLRVSEKSHAQIQREMGLGNGTIGRWLKESEEYQDNAFPGNGNPKDHEIHELKKELERTKHQRRHIKKSIGYFLGGVKTIDLFIDKNCSVYGVEEMYQLFNIAKSGYYNRKKRKKNKRKKENEVLGEMIIEIYEESR